MVLFLALTALYARGVASQVNPCGPPPSGPPSPTQGLGALLDRSPTLQELVRRSDVVLEARVLDWRSYRAAVPPPLPSLQGPGPLPFPPGPGPAPVPSPLLAPGRGLGGEVAAAVRTDVRLTVERVVVGRHQEREALLTLEGGAVEGLRQVYAETPALGRGELVLLFARRMPDGKLRLIDDFMGALTVRVDCQVPAVGLRLDQASALVVRAASGQARPDEDVTLAHDVSAAWAGLGVGPWPPSQQPVIYTMNAAADIPLNLEEAEVLAAWAFGYRTWDQASLNLSTLDGGTTDRTAPQADGHNDIMWSSGYAQDSNVLATAIISVDEKDALADVDIRFNNKKVFSTTGGDVDLATVGLHEAGHGIGLGHSADESAVMYFRYHGALSQLTPDDLMGLDALYGGVILPPPTSTRTATATPATTATPPSTATATASSTATASPSATSSLTATPTASPSLTATMTPTLTLTTTPTFTLTPSPSATPSASPTSSASRTATATATTVITSTVQSTATSIPTTTTPTATPVATDATVGPTASATQLAHLGGTATAPATPVLATASPTGPTVATPSATSTVGVSDLGGRGFTLRAGLPEMSWRPGTSPGGYRLLRTSEPGGIVLLPADGVSVSASATIVVDLSPPPVGASCYALVVMGLTEPLGLSDLLCRVPGVASGASPPTGLRVSLDESTRATLTWEASGQPDGYRLMILPAGASASSSLVEIPGRASSTSHDTGGAPTCYVLVALAQGASLGNTNALCAVPGVTTLAHP